MSTPSAPLSPATLWALRLLAHLPLVVFRFAGGLMGAVLMALARRRRRIVQRNLALCFPQASAAQRAWWVWQTFKHFGQSFVDRVWIWHGSPEQLVQRVQLTGDVAGLASKTPVLLFVPHFYGMDAGWARLTQQIDRSWWTFYSPQSGPAMDSWVRQGRQRFGAPRLVPRHEGVRPLVKGLRDGAALCLLPDMDLGKRDSVFVPFFGVPAATVTSLPRLAKVAGVPVRPWVCRMVAGGYRLEIMDEWPQYPSGDDEADARTMNQRLEALIQTMPGQYHWLHRRFKSRPPGEASVYKR